MSGGRVALQVAGGAGVCGDGLELHYATVRALAGAAREGGGGESGGGKAGDGRRWGWD